MSTADKSSSRRASVYQRSGSFMASWPTKPRLLGSFAQRVLWASTEAKQMLRHLLHSPLFCSQVSHQKKNRLHKDDSPFGLGLKGSKTSRVIQQGGRSLFSRCSPPFALRVCVCVTICHRRVNYQRGAESSAREYMPDACECSANCSVSHGPALHCFHPTLALPSLRRELRLSLQLKQWSSNCDKNEFRLLNILLAV